MKTHNKKKAKDKNDNFKLFLVIQIILGVIFLITYKYIFDSKLDLNGDNYNYLNYATSILNGHGYAVPYTEAYLPTNWYPPLYPSFVALIMAITGRNIIILKLLNGAFFLIAILILNKIMTKELKSTIYSSVIALYILLNTGLLRLSTIIMSEILFLFFSAFTLYYLTIFNEKSNFLKTKHFYYIVFGSVLTFYTRSIGISLIIAILLNWLLQKRWKLSAVYIGLVFLLYLPYEIRNFLFGLKGRYISTMFKANAWRPEEGTINSVSDFFNKMQVNLYDTVIRGFPETIFPAFDFNEIPKPIIIALGIGVLGFTLWGALRTTKQLKNILFFYIVGNIGIFLLWHEGNGVRYVWPIVPLITYAFFNGLYTLFLKKQVFRHIVWAVPIILLFLTIPKINIIHKRANQKRYHPAYQNYFNIAKSIKNTKAHVICRKPGMFYWHSECFVNKYKYTLNHKELIQDLIDKKTDFVVLEQLGYSSTARYLYPAIKKNQNLFKTVKHLKNPDTYLLQFNIEKAKKELSKK